MSACQKAQNKNHPAIPDQVRYNNVRRQTKMGGTLDTQRIVSELKAERNRLDKAIAALD